jgi:hypothetical protein
MWSDLPFIPCQRGLLSKLQAPPKSWPCFECYREGVISKLYCRSLREIITALTVRQGETSTFTCAHFLTPIAPKSPAHQQTCTHPGYSAHYPSPWVTRCGNIRWVREMCCSASATFGLGPVHQNTPISILLSHIVETCPTHRCQLLAAFSQHRRPSPILGTTLACIIPSKSIPTRATFIRQSLL